MSKASSNLCFDPSHLTYLTIVVFFPVVFEKRASSRQLVIDSDTDGVRTKRIPPTSRNSERKKETSRTRFSFLSFGLLIPPICSSTCRRTNHASSRLLDRSLCPKATLLMAAYNSSSGANAVRPRRRRRQRGEKQRAILFSRRTKPISR